MQTTTEKIPAQIMLSNMVEIQSSLNTKSYNTDWLTKGLSGEFDYKMAAMGEIIEFCDSLPYSWWSKAREDRRNCITELVDAWHFIMSQALIDNGGDVVVTGMWIADWYTYAQFAITAAEKSNLPPVSVKRRAKNLMMEIGKNAMNLQSGCSNAQDNYISEFFRLCEAYGVSLELLFSRYIA